MSFLSKTCFSREYYFTFDLTHFTNRIVDIRENIFCNDYEYLSNKTLKDIEDRKRSHIFVYIRNEQYWTHAFYRTITFLICDQTTWFLSFGEVTRISSLIDRVKEILRKIAIGCEITKEEVKVTFYNFFILASNENLNNTFWKLLSFICENKRQTWKYIQIYRF